MTGPAGLWVLADDGSGGVGVTVALTPAVVLTLLVVVLVLLVALVAWWGLAAAAAQPGSYPRRAGGPYLSARPGPARELASLRLRLSGDIAATERVVAATSTAGQSGPLRQLRQAARDLDAQLALLEGEPDQGYLAGVLAAVTVQVDAVADASVGVRDVARRLAGDLCQEEQTARIVEITDAVAGLRAGIVEVAALQRRNR
jgi:hypothetical protein